VPPGIHGWGLGRVSSLARREEGHVDTDSSTVRLEVRPRDGSVPPPGLALHSSELVVLWHQSSDETQNEQHSVGTHRFRIHER